MFHGFKLHQIRKERGELLNFMITPGDMDGRKSLEYRHFVEFVNGKLVSNKGYISKNLFERLFVDGIVQNDMKLKRSTYEVLQILCISLTNKTHLRDLFDKTKFNDVKNLNAPLMGLFDQLFNLCSFNGILMKKHH